MIDCLAAEKAEEDSLPDQRMNNEGEGGNKKEYMYEIKIDQQKKRRNEGREKRIKDYLIECKRRSQSIYKRMNVRINGRTNERAS